MISEFKVEKQSFIYFVVNNFFFLQSTMFQDWVLACFLMPSGTERSRRGSSVVCLHFLMDGDALVAHFNGGVSSLLPAKCAPSVTETETDWEGGGGDVGLGGSGGDDGGLRGGWIRWTSLLLLPVLGKGGAAQLVLNERAQPVFHPWVGSGGARWRRGRGGEVWECEERTWLPEQNRETLSSTEKSRLGKKASLPIGSPATVPATWLADSVVRAFKPNQTKPKHHSIQSKD